MGRVMLDESQAGIKIAKRNINSLRYADDTTLIAQSEEELKSLLMRVREEGEKACLKLNILKTKIMASGPITSWQIDEEKWKQWQVFFSCTQKPLQTMTAGIKLKEPCSWKESHDKPKSRDIILPTKQALGDSEGQRRLAYCSPWGRKELDIA